MHLRRTHDFDRRVPKNHRPSDCEESVEHLLFHCPRFAALRIKHGIRPPGDPTQWFERRVPEFLADAFNLLPDRESKEDHPPAGSSPPTAPPTTAHRAGRTLNATRRCIARATSSVTSFLRILGRKARNMACAKDDKQPPKSEPSLHTRKQTAASPSFRCTPPPPPPPPPPGLSRRERARMLIRHAQMCSKKLRLIALTARMRALCGCSFCFFAATDAGIPQ
ncbi:hypothetical protein XU18_3527 [Perkinsela sp. CCAP 1560/4]|nr:hypothetical protein XU18_3527 [Perkinsela sp. CCAP 1560/4]|eukprot:KNH05556.1 hypothetical protein XU18_3527 [Perkinsela sp. CCAP 1560/4]